MHQVKGSTLALSQPSLPARKPPTPWPNACGDGQASQNPLISALCREKTEEERGGGRERELSAILGWIKKWEIKTDNDRRNNDAWSLSR